LEGRVTDRVESSCHRPRLIFRHAQKGTAVIFPPGTDTCHQIHRRRA